MIPRVQTLLRITETAPFLERKFNCWSAAITKKHRATYLRTYPVSLVFANGSTINIQYHEPRRIIKLPVDLSLLTDAERKAKIESRKQKTKIKIQEEIEDDFDEDKYIKLSNR
ncbi:39S ribosomal protein L55, mitochondrial [Belonocnema kinseyi]|uniref:39S ribosomal protein L55, mitochondrial n=1 Tax=Belonocnema kinseyi TaxID=2817044 RepID=UPI00143D478C|nr:39S ribosomal protein L55, mitochondrial [Belonocnema kinseyi]